MVSHRSIRVARYFAALALALALAFPAAASAQDAMVGTFPPALSFYEDSGMGMLGRLQHRIEANPFNIVGTLIFLFAIVHTFMAGRFSALSRAFEMAHQKRIATGAEPLNSVSSLSTGSRHGGIGARTPNTRPAPPTLAVMVKD